MSDGEVLATETSGGASPVPSDHKRKLEELMDEPKDEPVRETENNEEDDIPNGGSSVVVVDIDADADASEHKRPRLEENESDALVFKIISQDKLKTDDDTEPAAVIDNVQSEDGVTVSGTKDRQTEEAGIISNVNEKPPSDNEPDQESSKEEVPEQFSEAPSQKDDFSIEALPSSEAETISRRIDVPNNKVGVLIGKAGDTIRFLQINSGARIQIMRDDEADLASATRPVELIGNAESINKAERLIKDVIAEADAGGSPSLVARGISTVQAAGVGEQLLIQVPNEKVGLIIGKGGETIKNLQTRSGARIQLIPQHPPEGDQSKERTVRVTGDKKQIEIAREMINDVMNQTIRPSTLSSGYGHQPYRPRGPGAPQWGPRGAHFPPSSGYDYQQRGPYPSQNQQYPASGYGNYPHQQMPPRGGYGASWDSRPSSMQGPSSQGGGYNYYGGRSSDTPTSGMLSNSMHASHGPGPTPGTAIGAPPQGSYNYGQPHDYGQPGPYGHQTVQPAQSYGHAYSDHKYDHQASMQHQYGGHGPPQTSAYPQGSMVQSYGSQDQYGKPPSYSMPPQGTHPQAYGQPRANHPGDASYQGLTSSTQPYGQNVATQQPYPYGSSTTMQQSYPPYGSVPAADGYNASQATAASGYAQQSGQPVAGYGQSVAQQAPGYTQVVSTAVYGTYQTSQPGYPEQPVATSANYGYQGTAPAPAEQSYPSGPGAAVYSATQASGQANYTQPAPTQPGYDQSAPPVNAYGHGGAPGGYGKSVSPQPGYPPYDTNQMYGTHS